MRHERLHVLTRRRRRTDAKRRTLQKRPLRPSHPQPRLRQKQHTRHSMRKKLQKIAVNPTKTLHSTINLGLRNNILPKNQKTAQKKAIKIIEQDTFKTKETEKATSVKSAPSTYSQAIHTKKPHSCNSRLHSSLKKNKLRLHSQQHKTLLYATRSV